MNGSASEMFLTTESQWLFLDSWSPWVQGLVICVALIVIALTYFNYRGLVPRWRRALLLSLRIIIVLSMLIIFYEPTMVTEKAARSRNHVVVLLDNSESMALSHGKSTRADVLTAFIEASGVLWERFSNDAELIFHRFSERVSLPLDPGFIDDNKEPGQKLAKLTAGGHHTRVIAALEEVRNQYRNRDLGAVLFLTDGIDTSPAGQWSILSPATEKLVHDLDAPISTLLLPEDTPPKDLSIKKLSFNNFAFLLNASSMEATLHVEGYELGQLEVLLLENGEPIASINVPLIQGQKDYPVTLQFVPRSLGKRIYTVRVTQTPDEIYAGNNSKDVLINVIRDKIRILQIVGQPSWDARFPRNHLKQNQNVDLISFFILVASDNVRPLTASETALIPFPAKELFEEELGGFDMVIFQNFNYGPFQTRRYLPNIAQFVRDGGAFLMIGGPLSLGAGGYYGTPIMDVLPVDIPPSMGSESGLSTNTYQAQLTELGQFHPVTRMDMDPALNQAIWKDMEPLEGANQVTRPKDDAQVLLQHPTRMDERNQPQPLVAVREVDNGRSMVIATDSLWHWSFPAGHHGADTRLYDTFWSNAFRWLIKDPELDLVRVRVSTERATPGEEVGVNVEVFTPDYRPAAHHPVNLVLLRRDPDNGAMQEVWRPENTMTNAGGVLALNLPVDTPGIHEIRAEANVVSGRVELGHDLFAVNQVTPELDTIVGDGRLPRLLAEASGGIVDNMSMTADPSIPLDEPRVIKVVSRKQHDLWNRPWVLLLIITLFTLEWWLRRRYGFL